MDVLKKYLFWFILLLVLVGSVAAHFFIISPLAAQTRTLEGEATDKAQKIRTLAQEPASIKTAAHVDAAKVFREHLDAQQEKILAMWAREGRLDLGEKFRRAPEQPLEFDGWVMDLRNEILNTAKTAGLSLPAEFKSKFLFDGQPTPQDPKVRAMRLQQLALVEELVKILSEARVTLTRTKFEPDLKKQGPPQSIQAGPLSLDKLEILPPSAQAERERQAVLEAFSLGGGAASGQGPRFATPFTKAGVTMRLTLPAAAVPDALRRLESSRRYFAVIAKIDVQRVASAYPSSAEAVRLAPGGKKDVAELLRCKVNTYGLEAPVQLLVEMDLYSFDEAVAKKMTAPPSAKSSKKRGRSGAAKKPAAKKK